jgi:transcriptional regulator with XRE-family HTH domain
MGTKARLKPKRLAEKLVSIRNALGLSQNEMIRRLGAEDMTQNIISNYELGKREPPLMILLEYARAANVYMEALVDDELDLPERLPGSIKSEGVRRQSMTGGKKPASARKVKR